MSLHRHPTPQEIEKLIADLEAATKEKRVVSVTRTKIQVRCGDKQREEMAAFLGEMFARGFLNQREYNERCTRAYAAVTASELQALIIDLPPLLWDEWRQGRAGAVPAKQEEKRRASLSPSMILALTILLVGAADTTAARTWVNFAWSAAVMLFGLVLTLRNMRES